MARRIREEKATEGHRVPAGSRREFVDHALNRERGVSMANRAPIPDRHREPGLGVSKLPVRNRIGHVDRALHRALVDPALERASQVRHPLRHEARQELGEDRWRRHDVPPQDRSAGGIETRRNGMPGDRAEEVVLHIVFPRPHHPDRCLDRLGHFDGLSDEINF